MTLDFKHTCPRINKNIQEIKNEIVDYIYSLGRENYSEEADKLFNIIEYYLEDFRAINEEMRSAADKQLTELEEEYKELITVYEQSVSHLEELK